MVPAWLTARADDGNGVLSAQERAALDRLGVLAAGLAQASNLGIDTGDGWSWDMEARRLIVNRDDLLGKGVEYCAGIVAHEIGHFLISRYLMFRSVVSAPSKRVLVDTLNALEDGRVEHWMGQRFPGVAGWLSQHTHADLHSLPPPPAGLPGFKHFQRECVLEPLRGFEAASPGSVPAAVAAALDRTRAARQAYRLMAPETSRRTLLGDPGAAVHRYGQLVRPQLAKPAYASADVVEREVQRSAWEAVELAQRDILPELWSLFEADVRHLAWAMQGGAAAEEGADLKLKASLLRLGGMDIWRSWMEATPPPPAQAALHPQAVELARQLLADESRRLPQLVLRPGIGDAMARAERSACDHAAWGGRAGQDGGSHARYAVQRAALQGQIDHLVADLDAILAPRRKATAAAGHASGARVDLRRLMTFAADPRQHRGLWRRPTTPGRRDAALSLLVDLSGSMRDAKIQAAVEATIIVTEALERLGVTFAVNGFQDEIIPVVSLGRGLTAQARSAILGMAEEVEGSRPGGHNHPGNNDDGPALRAAAAELLGWAATDRFLIVVSDGRPEGRHSDADDLRAAIEELSAIGSPLHLIGVGIGPDTRHVTDFYPHAVAEVPVDQFARVLGELVAGKLGEVGVAAAARRRARR